MVKPFSVPTLAALLFFGFSVAAKAPDLDPLPVQEPAKAPETAPLPLDDSDDEELEYAPAPIAPE